MGRNWSRTADFRGFRSLTVAQGAFLGPYPPGVVLGSPGPGVRQRWPPWAPDGAANWWGYPSPRRAARRNSRNWTAWGPATSGWTGGCFPPGAPPDAMRRRTSGTGPEVCSCGAVARFPGGCCPSVVSKGADNHRRASPGLSGQLAVWGCLAHQIARSQPGRGSGLSSACEAVQEGRLDGHEGVG